MVMYMSDDEDRQLWCQSCFMPMKGPEDFGTDEGGRPVEDYCIHCLQNGSFTEPEISMEEMREKVVAMMQEMGLSDEVVESTKKYFPMLKRWRSR